MFYRWLWWFSFALDAEKFTLKVGFICLFVVIDPIYLGATIVVAQVFCLSICNLSPTQNTCLTSGHKVSVYVCVCMCAREHECLAYQ